MAASETTKQSKKYPQKICIFSKILLLYQKAKTIYTQVLKVP